MPLTSEGSVSQVEGSKFEKGQMSASRDSAESDRPTRRRPASGTEDRLSTLQREDAEEFRELLQEGKDALLKRPPPDDELSQEHWLGLPVKIREKLWLGYCLDRMVEAIYRVRKEMAEKKARKHFEDSKLAKTQRSAALPLINAETSRTELSAWVGSTSKRRTAARRTPQPRGLRAKKLIAFRVGEGVLISDCYRSFRKVVHDAKRN